MKNRFIVIGDIHGNYEALKAVIDDALNKYYMKTDKKELSAISAFIFMGDYCCDFPRGQECINLIRKISKKFPTYVISGNREIGMTNKYYQAKKSGEAINWSIESTMGAPLIDCSRMSDDNLEYIANLPEQLLLEPSGSNPIFLTHRLPLSSENITLLEEKNIKNVICAHTHVCQNNYAVSQINIFNPGSVGLPDHGVPGAYYGVLESNQMAKGGYTFTTYHVNYDYEKAKQAIYSEPELFEHCKKWGYVLQYSIDTGVNCTVLYMSEINRISMFAANYSDKNINEIIELYENEYPEITFETYRDGYVDVFNQPLKQRVMVIDNGYIYPEDFPFVYNKSCGSFRSDWMYELAFKRLEEFIVKYNGAQMNYISSSNLLKKS